MNEARIAEAKIIEQKLDAMFPDKNMLNSTDICRYTGLSWNAVKRMFGLKRGQYIDKTVLSVRFANIIAEANKEYTYED